MADSYRGLTIKIGGDTSSLQKALRAATSAASSTQSQLRRVSQALKLDPSSLDNARTKMRLVSERAVDLNAKLSTMRQAMSQLDARGIGKAAAETQNAALRAEHARDAYNAVTAELASVYNEIKKVSGVDLRKKSDEDVRQMAELGEVTHEAAQRVLELRDGFRRASSELDTSKQVAQYKDLEVEMGRVSAEAASMASSFSRLRLEGVNAAQFKTLNQQIEQADRSAQSLEQRLRSADQALKLDPEDVGAAELKIRALAEQAQVAQQRMALLQDKLSMLKGSGADKAAADMGNVALEVERASAEYERMAKRVNEARAAIENLKNQQGVARAKGDDDEYARLAGEIRKAEAALQSLEAEAGQAGAALDRAASAEQFQKTQAEITETRTQVSTLRRELDQMGAAPSGFKNFSAIKSMGMTLMTTVTPAILGVGYSAATSAETLDSAFRDMKKTVEGTDEQFEALRKGAIEFSTTHITSADQLLEIEALGGQMGVATGDLESFAEVISNLDIATDINAEDAATQLGQLANITGMTSDQYTRFGDALVRLGNNMPSQESAIMDISSRIGSMASIVGMSVPDILAWSNAIASTGQNSEAAGTAIANTMSDIETSVGAGGDSLQAFADVAGMSAQQFADTWNSNPTEALKSFIEGLKGIDESGGSVDATLESLGIKGSRQKQAIMGLTKTIGTLNDSLEMSNDAWNGVSDRFGEAGDAAREAQQKSEGFSGAMGKLKNIASAFASELGEAAAPAIEGLTGLLAKLSDAFQQLPGPVKTGIVAFGGLAAAAGPIMTVYSSLGTFLSGFGKKASPAVKALAEGAKASIDMGGALGAVSSGAAEAAGATAKLSTAQKIANGALSLGSKALGALKFVGVIGGVMLLGQAILGVVQSAADFDEATSGLLKSTGALTGSSKDASNALSLMFGEVGKFVDSSIQLVKRYNAIGEGTDRVVQSQKSLAQSISDSNTKASGSAAQLEQYRQTIAEYGNQSGLTADEQSRLKLAVEGVNQVTGSQWQVVDAANGKIADEKGVVQDTTAAIEDYIEKKKLQIMLDAKASQLQDLYTQRDKAKSSVDEAAKGLYKATQSGNDLEAQKWNDELNKRKTLLDAVNASIGATNDSMAQLQSVADGTADVWTRLDVVAEAGGRSIGGLADTLKGAAINQEAFGSLSNTQLDQLASHWDGTMSSIVGDLQQFGVVTPEFASAFTAIRDSIKGMGSDVMNALDQSGVSVDQLAQKLVEAGVSSDTLSSVGSDAFARLAAACGGNVDQMITMLQNYNTVPIIDKNGVVNVDSLSLKDAQGNVWTWNGTTFESKTTTASVDDVDLIDGQNHLWRWDGSTLVSKEASANVDGNVPSGSAEQKAYDTNKAVQSMRDKTVTAQVNGNAANGSADTWLNRTINGIRGLFSKTVDVVTNFISHGTPHARGGVRLNAEGGIRAHARGMIATRAVPLDIVGEDGAEAIVPLTNKKYSQPFVDLIADGVNSRLASTVHSEVARAGMADLADTIDVAMADAASKSVPQQVDTGAIYRAVGAAMAEALAKASIGGDTYNMTMNGVSLNDKPGVRQITKDFLVELAWKSVV